MRTLRLLCLLLLACALPAQQPGPAGLTPKTGAILETVYVNVFFSFNFRLPKDWDVSFVAGEGPCATECMLLEVRAPGYPKLPRSISISAEAGASARPDHLAAAAILMERSGARKLSAVREITGEGRKMYRADYRSQLVNSDLYHAFIAMPDKGYLVVFALAAENRKQLDALADELTKSLSFMGTTSTSQ